MTTAPRFATLKLSQINVIGVTIPADPSTTQALVTDSMILGDTVVDVRERTRQINRIAANTKITPAVHSTPSDWCISAADLAAMPQADYEVFHDMIRLL